MMAVDFASGQLVIVDKDWLVESDTVVVIFVYSLHLSFVQIQAIRLKPLGSVYLMADFGLTNGMP